MVATLVAAGIFFPAQVWAQLPPRFYLKSLSGADAVPLIYESISGNTNPFDPSHNVNAGVNFDATITLAGYAHTFTLADRSAMAAIIVPTGRISGDVTVAGNTVNESASGFGDPMFEFDINVLGPRAQTTLPDVMRYEPGFSVDVLADLAVPIGEYDSSNPLNIGQNRWYGRLAAPIIWQLGPWVPGRRTTLEFLPSVWLYGDNTDYVGKTLSTDPSFQLDMHLTHDFTENFWGSLDAVKYQGGQSTIDGVKGTKLNNLGLGYTLGYHINDNLNLTFGYKSTINDNGPDDLKMDIFQISVVFGWHPLLEGARRLQGE